MAEKEVVYPWVRQEGESPQAYEAFRAYLNLGTHRSLEKVSADLPKGMTLLRRWSARWGWVARVTAYDRHLAGAATDGLVNELLEARSKDLELVDKLRGHLSTRLDDFIAKNLDPTVRWTQALRAMSELQKNAFLIKEDAKASDQMDRVEELLSRLDEEQRRAVEEA